MYDATDLYKYEIIHLNIRGARSNKTNLEHYLGEMNFPEIICLNETKLPLNKSFEIDGYHISARREHNIVGGSRGSLILTRKDIKDIVEVEKVKELFRFDEVLGIEIKQTASRPGMKVFSYYNPPLSSPNKKVFEYLASIQGNCLLSGDLNCKNTYWGSTKTDNRGIELLDTINQNNLVIFNDDSKTRCDPSSGKEESLDLIIGNLDAANIFREFWVGFDLGSDHYPVHISLKFKNPTLLSPKKTRRSEKMNVRKWERLLNEHPPLLQAQSASDLDTNVATFTSQVQAAFESSCPLTTIKTRPKCSFTPEIESKVKEKRKLRRQKNLAHQQQDHALVRDIMTQINRLGNQIKKLQKEEKKKELERHCNNLNKETNSKKFFKTFNIIANPIVNEESAPTTSRPVQDETGTRAYNSQEKTNLFANLLQRTHQEPDYKGFDEGWKVSVERFIEQNEKSYRTKMNDTYLQQELGDESVLCQEVTIEELEANLTKCKNRSAVGQDGISYFLIKKLPKYTKVSLCLLYSDAIRLGYFPKAWKTALVKMIPKPLKDSKLAKNFRPISLLNCLGKVLERILAQRLSSFLEEKKLFTKSQSGFRKHHMTTEQLLRLVEESHKAFKNQQTVAAVFLDAEAAFDRCWHNGIKYKMKKNLNLPDRIVRLLSSFLTDRTLTVMYEGCYSQVVDLKAGTPQGSPLSPIIYIIYVNDYPEEIQSICSLSQFADDTALWSAAYTRSYALLKVQKALNMLEGWCRRWRVKINGDKSNLLFITRTRESIEENFCLTLFDDIIRPVTSAKFLGVEIDSMLTFRKHFESVDNRSSKRLNVLKVLAHNGVEATVLMKLYKIYVRPLSEYGSAAFIAAPKTQISRLQKIQNQALRICLKLPSYIRTTLLHDFASIDTIQERLIKLNRTLTNTMKQYNVHINNLIENHSKPRDNCHLSPLDFILLE